jgi:hypothetical protein
MVAAVVTVSLYSTNVANALSTNMTMNSGPNMTKTMNLTAASGPNEEHPSQEKR